MKLENQVTNKEISNRLRELGVKQESLFYWKNYMLTAYCWQEQKDWWIDDKTYAQDDLESNDYSRNRQDRQQEFSAFTVAELGEMLPYEFTKENILWELYFCKDSTNLFACVYRNKATGAWIHAELNQTTEADARGKMLIYLLENKLITLN